MVADLPWKKDGVKTGTDNEEDIPRRHKFLWQRGGSEKDQEPSWGKCKWNSLTTLCIHIILL